MAHTSSGYLLLSLGIGRPGTRRRCHLSLYAGLPPVGLTPTSPLESDRMGCRCLGHLRRACTTPLSAASAAPGAALARGRGFADDASLKKTVLYDYHVAAGAKMVRAL